MGNPGKRLDFIATLSLMVTIIFWSAIPLFLKYFTSYIDAWTANGLRYPFAALVLSPWFIYFHRRGKVSGVIFRRALLPAFINLGGQILWAWAPYFVEPGLLSFTVRLSALWSVIASFFFFADERVLIRSKRFWFGLTFSIIGFIFIITGGEALPHGAKLTGILIAVVCSVFWAFYGITVRRNMKGIDSRLAFTVICMYTSIGTLFFMFLFGDYQAVFTLPPNIILLILISSIMGIAIAHVLFYVAMQSIGVAIASTFNLLSAFITAVFSFFLFQEVLNMVQWNAGLLLVLGAILLLWAQERVKAYQALNQAKD